MGGVRAIYAIERRYIGAADLEEFWCILVDCSYAVRIPCRGSFESVAQVDENTGSTYYLDTLSVTPVPGRQDNSVYAGILQAQLASMGPDDLVIIVEMWGGDLFVMGYGFADNNYTINSYPVFFGGGQYVSGTEKTDANGQSFTLTSVHPLMAANALFEDPEGAVDNPSTD